VAGGSRRGVPRLVLEHRPGRAQALTGLSRDTEELRSPGWSSSQVSMSSVQARRTEESWKGSPRVRRRGPRTRTKEKKKRDRLSRSWSWKRPTPRDRLAERSRRSQRSSLQTSLFALREAASQQPAATTGPCSDSSQRQSLCQRGRRAQLAELRLLSSVTCRQIVPGRCKTSTGDCRVRNIRPGLCSVPHFPGSGVERSYGPPGRNSSQASTSRAQARRTMLSSEMFRSRRSTAPMNVR
jgi:hypothetical protein